MVTACCWLSVLPPALMAPTHIVIFHTQFLFPYNFVYLQTLFPLLSKDLLKSKILVFLSQHRILNCLSHLVADLPYFLLHSLFFLFYDPCSVELRPLNSWTVLPPSITALLDLIILQISCTITPMLPSEFPTLESAPLLLWSVMFFPYIWGEELLPKNFLDILCSMLMTALGQPSDTCSASIYMGVKCPSCLYSLSSLFGLWKRKKIYLLMPNL